MYIVSSIKTPQNRLFQRHFLGKKSIAELRIILLFIICYLILIPLFDSNPLPIFVLITKLIVSIATLVMI